MGNGPTLYRAADHQCFKDVLVVQGKENPANQFDLLEVVEGRAARRRSTYDPAIFGGELGPCNPARLTDQLAAAAGRGRLLRAAVRDGAVPGEATMDAILLQLLNGLDKGGAYALIALGLTLIFGTLGVVNFAHGALFMLGAFCAVTFRQLLTMLETVTVDPTQLPPGATPLEIRTPLGADLVRRLRRAC